MDGAASRRAEQHAGRGAGELDHSVGLLSTSAAAAPLVVMASLPEALYSVTGDPSCSAMSQTLDPSLPFNVVRLRVVPRREWTRRRSD